MARSLLFSGLCALLLTSCSSVSTDFDYDQQVDFAKYKSFQWVPTAPESMANPMEFNQLADRRIRGAIESNLAGKGITPAAANPGLLVAYSTKTSQRTQVMDNGYYGYGYYGHRGSYWRPASIDVYQYEEGTLIIDLIDAQKKQLVWRGKAVGVVGDYAEADKLINEAVQKLFQGYPPQR